MLALGGFLMVAGALLLLFYRNRTSGEDTWARNARNQVRIARLMIPAGAAIFVAGTFVALITWIW